MSGYNFYRIENTEEIMITKTFAGSLFAFDEIVFTQHSNISLFEFLTCHITKDYKDRIFILENDKYKQLENYRRVGSLDVFIKADTMFVRGSYIDRQNFDKLINNNQEIKTYLRNPQVIKLDLYKALQDYQKIKTLSIRDYSATISKLKTSGQMAISDHDVTNFIDRSNDVTATTIIYPYGSSEFDVHIDTTCKIRLKDNDFDSSLEDQLNLLNSFYNDFIMQYRDDK